MEVVEVVGRQGRKAYFNGISFISIECSSCRKVKDVLCFRSKVGEFGGVISQCKECEANYKAMWHQKNKERINKQKSLYRKENPEKCKQLNQEGHLKHREKRNARSRKRQQNNLDKFREYNRKHYYLNKDKKRITDQRRRARKHSLPDNLSRHQLNEINEHFQGMCALSGEKTDLHLDHVIPLSIGHGGTIYGNMIPLSSRLNISKRDSNIFEWFDGNYKRLNITQAKFDLLIEYLAQVNEMTISEYRKYVDWCFDNPTTMHNS